MLAAEQRAERAFAVVDSVKRARGYAFAADSQVRWAALLGEDYTPMTTTLGSRVAKEVSTNPSWAAVLVRLLSRAGVADGDTVGLLVSASFPALALAALAAIDELGAEPILVSSLGASSYGANVTGSTWLDWERWVRNAGVLDVHSTLVTAGGEQDAAIGLSAEGSDWLGEAAQRNGTELARYASLADAIDARMDLLEQHRPAALVNVGGGQAAVGACPHAASLAVGLWHSAPRCDCSDRGVLTRFAEQGGAVVHLLQIRKLAALYGLDFEPGTRYIDNESVLTTMRVRVEWVLAALSVIIVSMVIPGKRLP
jgi:poly-gamma-glutamate system protein